MSAYSRGVRLALALSGAESTGLMVCRNFTSTDAEKRAGHFSVFLDGDNSQYFGRWTVDGYGVTDNYGTGGVWIGSEGGALARFNRIERCLVADGGHANPEGVGVVLGNAADCVVTRNEIRDFDYTGISVGWSWGYGKSKSWRNEISFNRIHDLGRGRMDDLAGVYTLGLSTGTCVSNNVISNISCVDYGGWGLYNDEGSEGIVMENNFVSDTEDGGYHLHYGRNNLIRNNTFARNRRVATIRVTSAERDGVKSSVDLVGNTIVATPGATPFFDAHVLQTGGLRKDNRLVEAKDFNEKQP